MYVIVTFKYSVVIALSWLVKCDTNNELIKSVKGNNRRPAQMNNASIMCDQMIKKIIHYELEHRIDQECYNLLVYNNVTEYSRPIRAEKKNGHLSYFVWIMTQDWQAICWLAKTFLREWHELI